ncbi:uncharacterized protein BDV17DRAFT_268899 [Aspergillus undulatus]|uniref:uncharacterized protein n=1 Tax=Aspergillus undulatus TaxID=1810928 RepID=UPI003CCCF136
MNRWSMLLLGLVSHQHQIPLRYSVHPVSIITRFPYAYPTIHTLSRNASNHLPDCLPQRRKACPFPCLYPHGDADKKGKIIRVIGNPAATGGGLT